MVNRRGGAKVDRKLVVSDAEAGVGSFHFSRILRLGFLSPDIVTAILRDRHPLELTAKRLANEVRIPVGWEEQHTLLGIA